MSSWIKQNKYMIQDVDLGKEHCKTGTCTYENTRRCVWWLGDSWGAAKALQDRLNALKVFFNTDQTPLSVHGRGPSHSHCSSLFLPPFSTEPALCHCCNGYQRTATSINLFRRTFWYLKLNWPLLKRKWLFENAGDCVLSFPLTRKT